MKDDIDKDILEDIIRLAKETPLPDVEDVNKRIKEFDDKNKPKPINYDIKYDI